MNFKYTITSLMVLLATFFMVSSTIAGTEGGLNRVAEIQVLGITHALSNEPYEYPPEVKFETAIEKVKLANEDSISRLGNEFEGWAMADALSPEHYEFASDGMGNATEANEYCLLEDTEDSISRTGGEIQLFGMIEALKGKC